MKRFVPLTVLFLLLSALPSGVALGLEDEATATSDTRTVVVTCTEETLAAELAAVSLDLVVLTVAQGQGGCPPGEHQVCAACCPQSGCAPPAICCDATCLCDCVPD